MKTPVQIPGTYRKSQEQLCQSVIPELGMISLTSQAELPRCRFKQRSWLQTTRCRTNEEDSHVIASSHLSTHVPTSPTHTYMNMYSHAQCTYTKYSLSIRWVNEWCLSEEEPDKVVRNPVAYAADAGCSRDSLNQYRHQFRQSKITSRLLIREDTWGNVYFHLYFEVLFFSPEVKELYNFRCSQWEYQVRM